MFVPGQTERRRDRHNAVMKGKSYSVDRGFGYLMEEFECPTGQIRNTLRKDIRDWLVDLNPEDEISILSGSGIIWITIYSIRDAAMFKLFWL